MKILSIAFGLLLLNLLIWFTYLRPEYKSAFEADQACHFEMSNLAYASPELGCDHDLETRQWILFDAKNSQEVAKVLKRFSY